MKTARTRTVLLTAAFLSVVSAAPWLARGEDAAASLPSAGSEGSGPGAGDTSPLHAYETCFGMQAASEEDIARYYERQQSAYVPLLLPDPECTLVQAGGTLAVADWTGFTKQFVEGLIPASCGGVTYWPVCIMEDAARNQRRRVLLNARGEAIAELPVPKDYDPAWWVKAHYPHLYGSETGKESSAEREVLESFFDGQRLIMRYELVEAGELSKLLLARGEVATFEDEGIGMMMSWQGGSVTNLEFVDIALDGTNDDIEVTLAYPDSFTNRIALIACTNMLDPAWSLLITTNPATATNTITYLDWESTNYDIRFYHAYDADCDMDGDGVIDGEEKFLNGTDPDDPNDPPNVRGTVSYTGGQTGPVIVVAVTTSNSWVTNSSDVLGDPGDYLITKLTPGTYYLRAWLDSDTNNAADTSTEAWGEYAVNPVTITGAVTNVSFSLTDPDCDADGVPDWWERRWFGTTNFSATNDYEPDGLNNLGEYQHGTCPTNSDSDADGLLDGVETLTGVYAGSADTGSSPLDQDSDDDAVADGTEVTGRTDPNNPDTAIPTIDIVLPLPGFTRRWMP